MAAKPHIRKVDGRWQVGEFNRRGIYCCTSDQELDKAWKAWENFVRTLAADGMYWVYFPNGGLRDSSPS